MTSLDDVKKYNDMENVLLKINQKSIALSEADKKINNAILIGVVDEVISRLRKQDALFNKMYQKIFYGGSYYDGLKINNPEEYDLDIILNLPKLLEVKLELGTKHGYVFVAASEFEKFQKSAEASKYPKLEKLIVEGKYFSTKNVRSWMEGIFSKVLKDLCNHEIVVNAAGQTLKPNIVNHKKSGPAFTLIVKTELNGKTIEMNIDLVTCFLMTTDNWPKNYVSNPVPEKNTFFVVPKKPYNASDNEEKYWRLSFQEQERELLKGRNYKTLKPSCKLIKQLRNFQNHKVIASYFIKTVFLWELGKQKQELWMNASLSFAFMTMLKRYAEYLKEGRIPYYWYPKYNLVEHISTTTIKDFGNHVSNIINKVEQGDPFTIATYLLPSADMAQLKQEVALGKKRAKKVQSVVASSSTMSSDLNKEKSSKLECEISKHLIDLLKDPAFVQSVREVYEKTNNKDSDVSPSDTPDNASNYDQIPVTNCLIDFDVTDDSTVDSFCTEPQVDVNDGAVDAVENCIGHSDEDLEANVDSAISCNSLDDIFSTQNDVTSNDHKCCADLKNEMANIKQELQHLRKVTETILHFVTTKSHSTTQLENSRHTIQKKTLTALDQMGCCFDRWSLTSDITDGCAKISLHDNKQAQKSVLDSTVEDLLTEAREGMLNLNNEKKLLN